MIAVNDYVIIRKNRPEEISNGILMPFDSEKVNGIGKPFTGIVESIGDEVTLVKENDEIVFYDLCQPWIIEDNHDLILILKETDIIGILNNG